MMDVDEDSLGSRFSHVYSVSNKGMHTIGGLQVHITWPLKV
jgi:hypothetical protein